MYSVLSMSCRNRVISAPVELFDCSLSCYCFVGCDKYWYNDSYQTDVLKVITDYMRHL